MPPPVFHELDRLQQNTPGGHPHLFLLFLVPITCSKRCSDSHVCLHRLLQRQELHRSSERPRQAAPVLQRSNGRLPILPSSPACALHPRRPCLNLLPSLSGSTLTLPSTPRPCVPPLRQPRACGHSTLTPTLTSIACMYASPRASS
jgi:hypothetical protein